MSGHNIFNFNIPPIFSPFGQRREIRTGVNTSVVEEFSESRSDRIVSTNVAQTIRSRDVTITGENFKPNTPYFIFFDGIDVSAHITPSSTTYGVGGATAKGTSLRSDNTGTVSAVFTIPNSDELSFSTGSKTLKITDCSSNAGTSLSQGSTQYSANGELQTVQEEIISTRNGRVVVEEQSDTRFIANDPPVRWVDPLAQSFLVDNVGGIFVTSVEIYIGAKDTNLPITIQIRHMENGSPTQRILPFGEKTLSPSSVTTTSDASTSTKFTFDSPVYLESGREYCAVVMSNSNVYTCWVSEMGKQDIQSNDFIDQQPYAGTLFKSQNNSTWTPDQMKDLKIKINRAKFTTGTAASVRFDNDSTGTDLLQNNPIEILTGTKSFIVSHYSHGNYDDSNSNVTIAGVIGDRLNSFIGGSTAAGGAAGVATSISDGTTDCSSKTITSSNSSAVLPKFGNVTVASNVTTAVVITDPGSGFSVGDTITINDVSGSDDVVFTLVAGDINDTLGGIPVKYINATHDASSSTFVADIDQYKITIPNATFVSGISNAIENAIGGGSSVTATYNAYFDTIQTAIPSTSLANTTITSTFKSVAATQPNQANAGFSLDSASSNLTLNDNTFLQSPKIVLSGVNETNELSNNKSLQLTTQLSSTADNVSPVLDVDTMGAIVIQNRINNITSSVEAGTYISSSSPRGDSNAAVYCTKKVQLENPANAIHIIFDGYRSPHTTQDPSIDVYYKILASESNIQFNDLSWIQASESTQMPKGLPPADASDFKEYEYNVEGLDEFVAFAIKIVLRSVDSSNVPLLENFRAIALSN